MENLEHLINLASRGGHGGASGGERRARAIVVCLLENLAGLDGDAVAGIGELITLIETQPWHYWESVVEAAKNSG